MCFRRQKRFRGTASSMNRFQRSSICWCWLADRRKPAYLSSDRCCRTSRNYSRSLHLLSLYFWRRARDIVVQHRCPLWPTELGITPTRTTANDLLHSYYLGPLLLWARDSIWCLLEAHIWGNTETTEAEKGPWWASWPCNRSCFLSTRGTSGSTHSSPSAGCPA